MVIHIHLKEIMEERDLSYRDVAKKAFNDENMAGTVHRIVTGEISPTLTTVDKICKGLGCKLEELLSCTKKKK